MRNSEIADLQRRLREAEAEAARLREQDAASDASTAAAAASAATAAAALAGSDTAATDSSATPVDPGASLNDPNAAPVDPNASAMDPNASAVDPATPVDPNAPAVDPTAAAIDPTAAPVDPNAPTADPNTAAADPNALAADGTAPPAGDVISAPVDGETAGATDAAATDATGAEVTPLSEPEAVTTGAMPERAPAWRQWMANPLVLGGAAILGVLALLGLIAASRRRRAPAAALDTRPSVADSFGRDVFPGSAAAAAVAVNDEEREMLDRLVADPTDVEAHMDLLRLHYANRDVDKFEAAAGALYAQLPDPDSSAWQETAAMGRELSPGNPMFDDAPADAYATTTTGREEFDFDTLETGDTRHVETSATATSARDDDFDFNLVDAPASASPSRDETVDRSSDFDDALPPPDLSTQQMPVLDLDLDEPARTADANEFFSGEDAVGTKLDLARAYLDMGDPEGARSMLEEVVTEGSASQRDEARRLLDSI